MLAVEVDHGGVRDCIAPRRIPIHNLVVEWW
jgi:hypothetical protein